MVELGIHGQGTWRFVALLLLLCLPLDPRQQATAQTSTVDPERPIWSADVLLEDPSAVGNRSAVQSALMQMSPHNSPGIIFLDDARLIVYEVQPTGKLSSRTSPDISSAFQLHASVLEAASGNLLFTKDWGARPSDSSINVTTGGILVRAGDVFRILSPDFAEVRRVVFPDSPEVNSQRHCDNRIIAVSPTRKTLLINCYNVKLRSSRLEVWDGNAFKSLFSWTESPPLYHSYSISDKGIAAADTNQRTVVVKNFNSSAWNRLGEGTDQDRTKDSCGTLPTLVSDNWLVVICNGVSLVSTEGQRVVIDPPEKMTVLTNFEKEKIAVSQNGQLAAVSLDRIERKKRFLAEDTVRRLSTFLAVDSLNLRKRILTVNLSPLPKANNYDFALSPDGSKLAILNGRRVSVYAIPRE